MNIINKKMSTLTSSDVLIERKVPVSVVKCRIMLFSTKTSIFDSNKITWQATEVMKVIHG